MRQIKHLAPANSESCPDLEVIKSGLSLDSFILCSQRHHKSATLITPPWRKASFPYSDTNYQSIKVKPRYAPALYSLVVPCQFIEADILPDSPTLSAAHIFVQSYRSSVGGDLSFHTQITTPNESRLNHCMIHDLDSSIIIINKRK